MRKRRSSTSSIRVVVIIGVGLFAAAVAAAFALPRLISAGGEPLPALAAGLCQSLEIDGTGQLRDKGMVSCDKLVGHGRRIDQVRDSFYPR
jgi:hypothetical protein